jgi:hypothetical protein
MPFVIPFDRLFLDKVQFRTYPKIITEALEPNTSPSDPVAERPALFAGQVEANGRSGKISCSIWNFAGLNLFQ